MGDGSRTTRLAVTVTVVLAALLRLPAGTPTAETEPLHRQALACLSTGDPVTAGRLLERALGSGPTTSLLLYHAGYAAYRRGAPGLALPLVERALSGAPDDPHVRLLLGLVHLELAHLPEATAAFRAVLARSPHHVAAMAYLGHCLALSGELPAARVLLDGALARLRHPGEGVEGAAGVRMAQVLDSLGYVCLRQEDHAAAESLLREALALDGALPAARFHLGLACYASGRTAESAAAFARVVAADPSDVRARYHLGLALLEEGATDRARKELEAVAGASAPEDVVTLARHLIEQGLLPEP